MKRLSTVWFQWCDILKEKKNYGDSKKINGCKDLAVRKGWINRARRIFRAVTSVWHYNGGYMSLYICQKQSNVYQKNVNCVM